MGADGTAYNRYHNICGMQFFPEQVQDEIHGLLILAVADGKQLFFDFNAVFLGIFHQAFQGLLMPADSF